MAPCVGMSQRTPGIFWFRLEPAFWGWFGGTTICGRSHIWYKFGKGRYPPTDRPQGSSDTYSLSNTLWKSTVMMFCFGNDRWRTELLWKDSGDCAELSNLQNTFPPACAKQHVCEHLKASAIKYLTLISMKWFVNSKQSLGLIMTWLCYVILLSAYIKYYHIPIYFSSDWFNSSADSN